MTSLTPVPDSSQYLLIGTTKHCIKEYRGNFFLRTFQLEQKRENSRIFQCLKIEKQVHKKNDENVIHSLLISENEHFAIVLHRNFCNAELWNFSYLCFLLFLQSEPFDHFIMFWLYLASWIFGGWPFSLAMKSMDEKIDFFLKILKW